MVALTKLRQLDLEIIGRLELEVEVNFKVEIT